MAFRHGYIRNIKPREFMKKRATFFSAFLLVTSLALISRSAHSQRFSPGNGRGAGGELPDTCGSDIGEWYEHGSRRYDD